MKKRSLHTYLLCLLISLCYSCVSDRTDFVRQPQLSSSDKGVFLGSPTEFELSLTRTPNHTLIQDTITDQGVSVKITERTWIGMSLDDEADIQTRSTWDDVMWERGYSDIGVFTVESSKVMAYLADNTTASFNIKCFPFRRLLDDGTYGAEGAYVTPSGNGSAANLYNYRNANFRVDARTTIESIPFFDNTDGRELNFYGYFPYQHQTAGIKFGEPATSICGVLQADMHVDNL